MNSRASDIRDVSLLSAACVVGAAISPAAAFVGLPLAGAGAAGLTYRGRWTLAAVAGVFGVVVAALLQPSTLVLTVPAVAGILVAVVVLRRVPFQLVGAVLMAVIAAAAFGMDALTAKLSGTSLITEITREADRAIGEVVKSLKASGATDVASVEQLGPIVAWLWPSAYMQLATLTVVLLIAAIAWAARRSGTPLPIPPMARLDLNINVIWLPVAALVLLAVGALVGGTGGVVFVVGLNVLLVARPLVLLQGLGVSAWLMERAGIGVWGRGAGYVLLVMFDTFFPVVTFAGLVDFWANFRKLPRDGQPAPEPRVRENES